MALWQIGECVTSQNIQTPFDLNIVPVYQKVSEVESGFGKPVAGEISDTCFQSLLIS